MCSTLAWNLWHHHWRLLQLSLAPLYHIWNIRDTEPPRVIALSQNNPNKNASWLGSAEHIPHLSGRYIHPDHDSASAAVCARNLSYQISQQLKIHSTSYPQNKADGACAVSLLSFCEREIYAQHASPIYIQLCTSLNDLLQAIYSSQMTYAFARYVMHNYKGLRPVLEGFVVTMQEGANKKSNPDAVSPRNLTYCLHKLECIETTNPNRWS